MAQTIARSRLCRVALVGLWLTIGCGDDGGQAGGGAADTADAARDADQDWAPDADPDRDADPDPDAGADDLIEDDGGPDGDLLGDVAAGDGPAEDPDAADVLGDTGVGLDAAEGAGDGPADIAPDGDDDETEAGPPVVTFPRLAIAPEELGVIVNLDDPLSEDIADYYMQERGIPPENRLEVSMGTAATLSSESFEAVETAIADAFGPEIQALALTALRPFRVDCMGVTAAVALGFDEQYCQAGPPCLPTAAVSYYDSDSTQPHTDHGLRPTMILAAQTFDDAEALIDRGLASDGTYPGGNGWFVRTTDSARSVRYWDFASTVAAWDRADGLTMTYVDNSDGSGSNVISDESDVLFYFTGLTRVDSIETNSYRPGAVADHLTSSGGSLPGGGQMSALAWLEAGATASYGTAVEPCNYESKFPRTSVFVPHYFRGETVVEAYWKSVHWPGEGNFVGEPLARPFGPPVVDWVDGSLTIETTMLIPGRTYLLESAPSADGPWTPLLEGLSVPEYRREIIQLDEAWAPHYRLREADPG